MEKKYIAHINEELKTEQTVKEHSENVAILAEEYAVERFKKIAYVTGLLHDCGKYQESFQKRISGSDIRVEHSTCGAIIVKDMSENKSRYPLGILSRMMEYCIADAKEKGRSGICMLGAKKQKSWLSDQSFAKKFGFEVVDTTDNGYELLALSFDGTMPKFAQNAKKLEIESKELTIYYDMQCPYIDQKIGIVRQYCEMNDVPLSLIQVDTLQKAKELPCVFNNWGVFYKGNFETVNLLLDVEHLKRILKK